jgi:hypothetical protein
MTTLQSNDHTLLTHGCTLHTVTSTNPNCLYSVITLYKNSSSQSQSFICCLTHWTMTGAREILSFHFLWLRLSMSLSYPWLITGILMGKPMGMATCRSELLVITGLHRSGCLFWVLWVLATSTCDTKVFSYGFFCRLYYPCIVDPFFNTVCFPRSYSFY